MPKMKGSRKGMRMFNPKTHKLIKKKPRSSGGMMGGGI